MNNIEKIKAEIERRKKICEGIFERESDTYYQGKAVAYGELLPFIDSLPEDTSCVYDTNKLTPTPSVNIEDVARVQFASHAHVFDRKRKAVFDWEQFKEVVGIFYGFGKRDSLPEEKPSDDLEEAASRGGFDYVDEIEAKAPGLPWNDHDVEFGYRDGFIAGAEWMRKKDVEDMYMSDNRHFLKCYEQGKVDMKVEMMKDAVDAEITVGRLSDDWSLAYNPDELHRALLKFKSGDKVKIIIVKQ